MKNIPLLPTPAGCFVKIVHIHDAKGLKAVSDRRRKQAPRYATYAYIYEEGDAEPVAVASAFCSHKDTPSRKAGRAIAHNRVVSWFNRQIVNQEVAA